MKICECTDKPPAASDLFCMKDGKLNRRFTVEAYLADHPAEGDFGQDCRNGHPELLETVKEFPEFPHCPDCGWKAEVRETEQTQTTA